MDRGGADPHEWEKVVKAISVLGTLPSRIKAHFGSTVAQYQRLPTIDLSPRAFDAEHGLIRALLYYLMPAWMISGVLDWWWHRKTDIEHTSGLKESAIHALMFTEIGVPILVGLAFRINAGTLLAMWGTALLHEITAFWDVSLAEDHREVAPREQHTHSFLEVIPVTACMVASCLHWDELRSLVGLGDRKPDFRLRMKEQKIPDHYWPVLASMVTGIAVIYGNELYRCWRARGETHYDKGFY
jgi:hypothetical protein